MMLGELITALAAADPNQVIPHGFDDPHSYRGYYDELAFQPAENITIAQMLEAARGALGATYQGYKGGDYRMDEYTDCWLAEEGSTGETIGPLLIRLMLEPQAAEQPLAPGPRVHGNCPACKHASLLLGTGGYITCNNPDCTETDAATTVLEQYGAEAHPPQHSWRVETRDPLPDEWAPGSHFASRPHAVERYETANSRAPRWKDGTPVERRIVRETTTYTVEKPAQPASGAELATTTTVEAQQPETQTDHNSGVGWYEVIHPKNATTCIAYVHENGDLYLPEGDALTPDEFAFAAARGRAHRLVRIDDPAVMLQLGKEV